MSSDNHFREIQNAWQKQNDNNYEEITMEAIMSKSDNFKKTINKRNSLEWVAAAAIAPVFFYKAIHSATWWSLFMNLELVLAAVFIGCYLFFQGRNNSMPDSSSTTKDFIKFQRMQLQKQIDLLSRVRYWYIAPIMFGLVGLILEKIWFNWSPGVMPWRNIVSLIVVIALGAGITWLNEVKTVNDLKGKLKNLPEV